MYHPEKEWTVSYLLVQGALWCVVAGGHAPLLNEQTWGVVMVSNRRQKEQIGLRRVCV